MKNLLKLSFYLLTILILASCNIGDTTSSRLTIEPYSLSEEEQLLISKTGVSSINYFLMNGKLLEDEDLHYEVKIYKNGQLTDEKLGSFGETQSSFKDTILSFGVNNLSTSSNEQVLTILAGQPGGLMSSTIEHHMKAWSLSSIINQKVSLVKNEPLYLAAWIGTTKETFQSGYGNVQDIIKGSEFAIIYKITLVDS